MNDLTDWVQPLVEAVQQSLGERPPPPQATYRLEFRHDRMTFHQAAQLVPYLEELGISHLYASPCLKTRSGSTHGYAVVDYGQLNPELGTPEEYAALAAALGERGMGQLLDFVPNHMSVAPAENRWWQNVLENGPGSPFAAYFDIDWHPVKEELKHKILLPVLGGQFGQVLEAGQLTLEYREGAFFIRYFETVLPLNPKTATTILRHRLDELKAEMPAESEDLRELESVITALDHLPGCLETKLERVAERQREKEVAKDRLKRLSARNPEISRFIERNLRDFNGAPDDPHSFDRLEELLGAQVYRLSHWKAAGDEINYRRFFDVNDLAAVSMEELDVFEDAHRLVFELLVRRDVAGLRIDHIDGLYDPMTYLWRLQWGYLRALGREAHERQTAERFSAWAAGKDELPLWKDVEPLLLEALWTIYGGVHPLKLFQLAPPAPPETQAAGAAAEADGGHAGTARTAAAVAGPAAKSQPRGDDFRPAQPPLFVVVEKILGPEEPLPEKWPVAGTTGYDFLALDGGLFVDPQGLAEMLKTYDRFLHHKTDFREIVFEAKRLILRTAMASELSLLALRLNRLSECDRRSRDFTLNSLRFVLREILACFPVYRTYVGGGEVSERDRNFIHRAVAQAKRRNPAVDAEIFDFVRDVLLLKQPPSPDAKAAADRDFFIGRFQQVTSPVMAKGVEDTAFYRYLPLASLNEVGGAPASATVSVETFHRENLARLQQRPRSLLATTTHDTKRSEDVRARISVLSEIPREWRKAVSRWSLLNRWHHREIDGQPAPSRNDEYLFYQSLVGVWPLRPPDDKARADLVGRLQSYMEKASHEAKINTSWINPSPEYGAAVRDFVAHVLEDRPKNRFLEEFCQFHQRLIGWGLFAALSQVFLKLTAPGVPDIYQGQELWDFSLVDPDNRRPVDFGARRDLLARLKAAVCAGPAAQLELARQLARDPSDDRLKLFVTWRTLHFRRHHDRLLHEGRYIPLEVIGPQSKHVCALAWRWSPPAGQSEQVAIVVAPRLLASLAPAAPGASRSPPPIGGEIWHDTQIELGDLPVTGLTNLFTAQPCPADGPELALSAALADFPVSLLVNTPTPHS
jgi:(1->4)-alpha-D-glucan 1-alpha-D-glucosylmutase